MCGGGSEREKERAVGRERERGRGKESEQRAICSHGCTNQVILYVLLFFRVEMAPQ